MPLRLSIFCVLVFSPFWVWAKTSVPFEWLVDSTHIYTVENMDTAPFIKYSPNTQTINKSYTYWLRVKLENHGNQEQTVLLTFPNKWGYITVYSENDSLKSGSFLPLKDRAFPTYTNGVPLRLKPLNTKTVYLKVKGGISIYVPDNIELERVPIEEFHKKDAGRLWSQGIFFGIILIMGLYNLVIYLSVRDISYLFYTLSIFSVGTYFLFYYGFGLEKIWPNSPNWDTFSYAFITPFTNWARLYFTKNYLHLSHYSKRLDKLLSVIGWVCLITLGATALCYFFEIDVLNLLVDWIGLMGTTVLSLMFFIGWWVYRQGYPPAKYFNLANFILVLGGILFIFREIGFMNDNYFTRYGVQIGVIAQVVLFSLGLSSRLNQTQTRLATLQLEGEREKKKLAEEQKLILIDKVKEQTSDLRELNQLKDKLLSIISHDLRNPLVSLNSFLNLLINHQDRLDEKEQKKLAEKAQQSLDNLDQLLGNMLYWSRSQMNLLHLNKTEWDLGSKIENTITALALEAELKNIKIGFVKPKDSLKINADQEMFAFVFRNVLGNAIKFSRPDSSTISIGLKKVENKITIIFKDNGVGMTEEQIRQIYTQPAVISTRGTSKEKGTGLGLVLCKEFIEMHGGKLLIESELNSGTTVEIEIPID